jgi:energy-coupling factor transport system permease protein
VSYRRRPTPLHSARAGAGCLYCVALALAALMLSNPIALGALALAVAGAAWAAGAGPMMLRGARFALPFVLFIAALNALVTRNGLTVIIRLGDLPLLGHTDITLEATVYGAILALRALVVLMCGALYTAAVDPDEVLRLLRPLSFRSALTATLATRMIPVLIRDSRRQAEAQRCRPGAPPSRVTLMRAASAGMLDRALDVAAVLEVRGYGVAGRPRRRSAPYNRHDLEFTAAAVAVTTLALATRLAGWAAFSAYPALHVGAGAGALAAAGALLLFALAPFLDRRGVGS